MVKPYKLSQPLNKLLPMFLSFPALMVMHLWTSWLMLQTHHHDWCFKHSCMGSATATDQRWVETNSFIFKENETSWNKVQHFDHELLAMYLAIKHFQHFVKGQQFHVLADHKPLTFAFSIQSSKLTPCQIQHLDFISQFTTDIRHVKGSDNPVCRCILALKPMLYILTSQSLLSLTSVTMLLPNSEILNFNNYNHHLWNYNQFHYLHPTQWWI